MSLFLLKIPSGAEKPKPVIKHFFGQNMKTIASKDSPQNLETLKHLIAMGFNDPLNNGTPFRQLVLVEEVIKDPHERITAVLCKAYFFREDEKCLVIEVGKKNSLGQWELKDKGEIQGIYERHKYIPSRWTTIDFAVQQIKLRGKANTILFYDELSVKKNMIMNRLIANYFLNPNVP
jgi:hypothetical protein